MNKVQQPDFQIFYDKHNITENVKPYLKELSYTDYLADQSDEISVTFEDIEGKWIRHWFPTQGDKLKVSLGYVGQELVKLGAFEIDTIEFSYNKLSGTVVSLKALSTGTSKSNRTLKPKAYENTTLKDIVHKIAKKEKLKVKGDIENIPIQRVTQYQERNVEFLTRLAHEYNYSFKIVNKVLVFTTMDSLARRNAVREIDFAEVLSIQLRDSIRNAVKAVDVKGFSAIDKKTIGSKQDAKAKRPTEKQASETNGDTLKLTIRGESQAQINARANAALAQQTDDRQSGSLSLIGDPKLVAGNTVILKGLGMFTGKYLIQSARHNFSREQGYLTNLEVRMIEFIEEGKKIEQSHSA